jgi:hypothetical protein
MATVVQIPDCIWRNQKTCGLYTFHSDRIGRRLSTGDQLANNTPKNNVVKDVIRVIANSRLADFLGSGQRNICARPWQKNNINPSLPEYF